MTITIPKGEIDIFNAHSIAISSGNINGMNYWSVTIVADEGNVDISVMGRANEPLPIIHEG